MTDNARRTGAALEAHYQFLAWLLQVIEKFPKNHKFTVGDRIALVALDILEALIEATYTRERMQHLRRANLGIEKLRFLLRLAADLRLLDRRRYEHAARSLDEVGRLIGGWIKAYNAATAQSSAPTSMRASAPGSRIPRTPIRGAFATRSSGAAGLTRP
jgi:23S rRNA-intervening sequence protein